MAWHGLVWCRPVPDCGHEAVAQPDRARAAGEDPGLPRPLPHAHPRAAHRPAAERCAPGAQLCYCTALCSAASTALLPLTTALLRCHAGFLFDSSIPEPYPTATSPEANDRLWPYTMDYGLPQRCDLGTGERAQLLHMGQVYEAGVRSRFLPPSAESKQNAAGRWTVTPTEASSAGQLDLRSPPTPGILPSAQARRPTSTSTPQAPAPSTRPCPACGSSPCGTSRTIMTWC